MNHLKDTLFSRFSSASLELSLNAIDLRRQRVSLPLSDIEENLARTEAARIAILEAMYQLEPVNHDTPFKEVVKKHLISTGFIFESEYSEFESQLIAEIAHYMEKTRQSLLSLITKKRRKGGKMTYPELIEEVVKPENYGRTILFFPNESGSSYRLRIFYGRGADTFYLVEKSLRRTSIGLHVTLFHGRFEWTEEQKGEKAECKR